MTPTLSQLPFSRLATLRRVPFWAQALALCALFAIVGVVILDDYGVGRAEPLMRYIAIANADYIATGDISEISQAEDESYRVRGMVFEAPLLLAERALRQQDTRHVYLTRHLLTHIFFIAGGFACGMLAYRMLGSRWVALLAMLMFLLHPRLYAHSFFNTRDIPFAILLIIALYLTHRAFRKDTVGSFLLCGIGAGLAIDLRPFGLMLPPMILAMRALDLWQASGGPERKRILMTGATLTIATLATVYIIHPYYWENPLRFFEGIREVVQRSVGPDNLFMGEIYLPDAVPWNYIPVWFAITAPPLTLVLGVLGAAVACWQGVAHPLVTIRDHETRFCVLLLGCIVLPVMAAIVLQTSIYQGWRHTYFLWGPFCLLSAVGLGAVVKSGAGGWARKGVAARLPVWVRGGGLRRALAYGVVGVGLITTLTAMAALHPNQQVYFNALTDTKTPGALANRYDMDYWLMAHPQLLAHLLARYPDDTLRVWFEARLERTLPQSDRDRIVYARATDADFYFNSRFYYLRDTPDPPKLSSIEAYGSVFAFILAPNSDAYRDYYRAEYNDIEANGILLSRSTFDIYAHNGAIYYISANCAPLLADDDAGVFLHIFPADDADLPADGRGLGFENLDFRIAGDNAFFTHTAFFDGKCIAQRPLPDYPIARIRTGQNAATDGGGEWRADIDLAARAAAQAVYDGIAAGDYGRPVAQSHFDMYLSGKSLAYLKEPCAAGDADAWFFLHIIPADPAELPADRQEHGFANLDFQFGDRGAYIGDKCVAMRELPGYAIERIRTGQFVSGEGQLWDAAFPVSR